MTKLLTIGLAFALALSFACGGGAPAGTTTTAPVPAAGTPPPLTISDGGSSMQAALGSYCWPGSGSGPCADAIALITSRQPLITTGDSVAGELSGLKITDAHVDASPVAGSQSVLLTSGLIEWTQAAQHTELPVAIDGGQLKIDISSLQSGYYVIAVSLQVKGRWDAAYGFLLDKGSVAG